MPARDYPPNLERGGAIVARPSSDYPPLEVPPGPASPALWERVGNSVILEGECEFDFNLDGTPEAATLRQVLIPN